ncbi:hypothetical protein ACOSQ4_017241 [Xanthoceras sorbifolium]
MLTRDLSGTVLASICTRKLELIYVSLLNGSYMWIFWKTVWKEFCFRCGFLGHPIHDCMAASSMNQMAGLERHHFGAWLRAGSPPRSTNKTTPTEGHQPGNKTCSDGKGNDIPSPSFTSSQNKGDTEVGISIENAAPAGLGLSPVFLKVVKVRSSNMARLYKG